MTEQEQYNELCAYTLSHRGGLFIHQHVVDAWTAQHADEQTKPIALTFALIGLYLHVEKHYSGTQVQRTHMQTAKRRRRWPTFRLPKDRGRVTVLNVMNASPGPERDEAIHRWCASVWQSLSENRDRIIELLAEVAAGHV
jgi:hypothetical protein